MTTNQKTYKYTIPLSNMALRTYHKKALYYSDEFAETYEMFQKIIKNDSAIKDLLPPNKKKVMIKNGLDSFAIRLFISQYVQHNKHKLTKKQKEKYETPNTNKEMDKSQE